MNEHVLAQTPPGAGLSNTMTCPDKADSTIGVAAIWTRIRQRISTRNARNDLYRLSDHTLSDIGLNRDQIHFRYNTRIL